MKKYILFTVLLFPFLKILSQTTSDYGVKFSGYINLSGMYDTRKIVAAREGHFLLYPREELIDANEKDVNAVSSYNLAVILTRLGAKFTAPEFLNAKPSAFLETEFLGNSDTDVNGFRIRHAYINLDWENTSLLLGQTWNPMFIPEAFPLQVGSNAGAPFQPFARNPQIRLTQSIDNFKIIAAVTSQRDFASSGPAGSTNEYLRNAVLPDFHLHLQLRNKNNLYGVGAEYKNLKPTTETSAGYATDNTVNGYSFMGYSKLNFDLLTVAAEGIYGANLTDLTMLGGYAVKSTNTITKSEEYTALKVYSVWCDISYGNGIKAGLFGGYTKNLGADDLITGKYYARGSNIESIYRLAPRLEYQENKIKISLEVEYTNAAYGTPNNYGEVQNSTSVGNTRITTSIFYFL